MEADDGYAGEEVSCPNCNLIFNAPDSASSGETQKPKKKKRKKKPKTKIWADYLPMPEASRQLWRTYSLRRFLLCMLLFFEITVIIALVLSGGQLSTFVRYLYRALFGVLVVFIFVARGHIQSFERERPSSLVKVVGSALVGLNLFLIVAVFRGGILLGGMQAPGNILRGATTADGDHLLVAGNEGFFTTRPYFLGWNTKSRQALKTPKIGKINAIGFAQTGPVPLAIAGTDNGGVEVWDTRDGVATASLALARVVRSGLEVQMKGLAEREGAQAVQAVALLDQGRVAVAAAGTTLHMWDTRSRDKIFEQKSRSMATAMAPSPDGKRVAVANRESMPGAGARLPTGFMKDAGLNNTPDVVPGGTIVALSIWDITGERPMTVGSMNYRGETVGRIRGMAFSPQGDRFLAGAERGYVYLYELKDRKLHQVSTGHYPDGIRSVAFSKTGKYLAAGTAKGRILLFDKDLEQPIKTFSVGSIGVNVLTPTKNPGEFLYTVGKRIKRLKVK